MRVSKFFACCPRILAVLGAARAAQTPAEFYKGKTVDMMIGYSVGGGYDVYARLIARHMGKHIPGNPTVTPKNMEGAGSLRLANWLYNVAPKDGTVFGTIGRGTGFDPLFGHKAAQFDGNQIQLDRQRQRRGQRLRGLERPHQGHQVRRPLTKQLIVGGTGAAADTDQFPRIINGVLGTKMKIVTGYPGGNDVNLAMERGEVDGRCGWSWSSVKSTRAHVDQGQEDQHPGAAVAAEASGPARRAADHRARQDRGAARRSAPDVRAPGAGPALSRAARSAGRTASPRCARPSWPQ